MRATILGLLKKKYPEAIKKWDGWHYKILSPVSLDDLPMIQVYLRNKGKGGLQMQLGLDLEGAIDLSTEGRYGFTHRRGKSKTSRGGIMG